MANKNRKCKFCEEYKLAVNGVKTPVAWFCSFDHARKFAEAKRDKDRQRQINKSKQVQANQVKSFNRETKRLKESIKKRTGPKGFYDNLKTVLHYYIKHVLRKGEPCYTVAKLSVMKTLARLFTLVILYRKSKLILDVLC
jgi:hypothetical protein